MIKITFYYPSDSGKAVGRSLRSDGFFAIQPVTKLSYPIKLKRPVT